MLRHKSLLERIVDSIARTLDEWGAMMRTRDFWGIVAVGSTVVGFLLAAGVMLIDFDAMRMRNCFNASNISAYLMFNTLLFFVFGGMLALGEAFNYFDNKRRGIPHRLGSVFWLVIITTALGSIGLVMLKISC
jgi:hypothetical protein